MKVRMDYNIIYDHFVLKIGSIVDVEKLDSISWIYNNKYVIDDDGFFTPLHVLRKNKLERILNV